MFFSFNCLILFWFITICPLASVGFESTVFWGVKVSKVSILASSSYKGIFEVPFGSDLIWSKIAEEI